MPEFPDSDQTVVATAPPAPPEPSGWFSRFLRFVEWLGNLLPCSSRCSVSASPNGPG